MNLTPPTRLTLVAALGVLLAGCAGNSGSTVRVPPVDEIVPPALLQGALGAPAVETSNAEDRRQYLNRLDQSTLSSAEFQTTNTPVRLLKVRLSDKPQGLAQARQEFLAQKDEFQSIRALQAIEGVKVGDEAAAYQTDQGRNIRLVARLGTKVTSLHVRGSGLPEDSLPALQTLALHILTEAEKRSPSPAQ